MEHVFALWPTVKDLAGDLNISEITVRHWRRRKNIPSTYDARLVEAAAARGKSLSFETLAMARASKARARPMTNEGAAA